MRTVKRAVFVDHFRLYPQAEFKPQRVYFVHSVFKLPAELTGVHIPVAEAEVIRAAFAEPAVVQHEHLYAELRRLRGYLDELFTGEIKIRRLPIVDQNGAVGELVRLTADVVSDEAVEYVTQAAKARIGKRHYDLRREKVLTTIKQEVEALI